MIAAAVLALSVDTAAAFELPVHASPKSTSVSATARRLAQAAAPLLFAAVLATSIGGRNASTAKNAVVAHVDTGADADPEA